MDDETNPDTQEVTEVEALPEVETETEDTTEEPEPELDEDGNPVEEPAEPEEETTEIVKDGKAYKVPAALKDEILMHADYTRKTQEVAELRKSVDATLQQVQQVTQLEQQAAIAIGTIDAQIADFNTIDWDAWEDTDPIAAQRAWRQFGQLKESRGAALNQYQQAQQQRTFVQQQETAKLVEQGQRELAASIPEWGPEKATALLTHANKTYGFAPEELNGITDPRMIKVLNDAFQFRQASKTQQAVKKVETQQAFKPAAKVATGKAPSAGLSDKMSADAWMKARNAQLAKRN
jgi:hypothetical protein